MYATSEEIYGLFRKAQAEAKNRPYRLPKDFEKHLEKRFSEKNRDALELVTKYFKTKWMNVDPYRYFQCGFEILKNFSYINFFDDRVMNLYIARDKHLKRDIEISKRSITDSFKFVLDYMKENDIPSLHRYCLRQNGESKIVIKHYMKNKIDKFFLVYLINKGSLILSDDDRALLPYIVNNYRNILESINNIKPFTDKIIKKFGI